MSQSFINGKKFYVTIPIPFRSALFTSLAKLHLVVALILCSTSVIFADGIHTHADSVMRVQQEWRYGVFFHFNMNTFYPGWANNRVDPKLFNPAELNCGQWAQTFRDAGMKFALPILSVCLFLSGCGSMKESIVPAGHPKYEDIGKIVQSIKKGTPKWAVKMKLGNPAVRSPNSRTGASSCWPRCSGVWAFRPDGCRPRAPGRLPARPRGPAGRTAVPGP